MTNITKIGKSVQFADSTWEFGYEELPVIDSDLGITNQDGYVFGILRDGKEVYSVKYAKGQVIGDGTIEHATDLLIKGANTWLKTNAIPIPATVLSDWKQGCMAIFARLLFQIKDGVLSIVLGDS